MAIRTKAAGDDVVPKNLGGAHDATALEQEPVRHTELDAPLVVGEDVAAELDEGHVWATGDEAACARACVRQIEIKSRGPPSCSGTSGVSCSMRTVKNCSKRCNRNPIAAGAMVLAI